MRPAIFLISTFLLLIIMGLSVVYDCQVIGVVMFLIFIYGTSYDFK